MRRALRENALCASIAGGGCAAMAWLGLYSFAWNDYEEESRAAYTALVHGHMLQFLRLAPAYGGSLIERAPFALLPGLWGGGDLAVYRLIALPCLLAAAALAVWLNARMRAEGGSTLARAVVVGVCVANPITLVALELGHPEELLGGCMCVAALLLAARERPLWAGLLLGLAIANKEWALLAAGPVLLALPAQRRLSCLLSAGAVAGALLAPLVLVGSGGFVSGTKALATPSSTIFQPWQLWWFLGHHGPLVHGAFGAPKPGYRTAPAWTGTIAHPLIILIGLTIAGAMWLRTRGKALAEDEALLGLTLVLLLRCVLDTWDITYYLIPFLLALLNWETREYAGRPPVLALSSTVLAWISFQWLAKHASADTQAAFFLAWTLPLTAALGLRLLSPRRSAALWSRLRGGSPPPQETTVSSLQSAVRTS